mgnify:FL=1
MISSGLLVCSFYLKKKFSRCNDNVIDLNRKINDEENNSEYADIFELFNFFLNDASRTKDDERSMKLFSVLPETITNYDSETYRATSFVVNSGSYGLESEITDRISGQIKYKRTRDDADIKQFYCLIYVPKDVDGTSIQKGIMLFQTLSTYGIKTITTQEMKEFFSKKGITLETRSVSVRMFMEKIIENGSLTKVTLVKNSVSPDSSDNMFISTGREEKSYIKPKLKQNWINKFLDFLDGKDQDDIFEINDEKFQDIRITFSISGKSRTVRANDIDRFSVVEEIPDSIFNNGKYSKERLINHMITVAETYKSKMVFRIE